MKVLIVSVLLICSCIFILTYSSEEWTDNDLDKAEVYDKDLPYLNATERIIAILPDVQYAAIIYPKKHRIYPNSIFHKYIMGDPKESTSYGIKADVLYTIKGDSMASLTYSSSGTSIAANAIFVGLCKSGEEFYAPDNGYEFPATQEAIAFVNGLDRKSNDKSIASACSN